MMGNLPITESHSFGFQIEFKKYHMKMYLLMPCLLLSPVLSLQLDSINVALDYFEYKRVNHLVYLSCARSSRIDKYFIKCLMEDGKIVSVIPTNKASNDLRTALTYNNVFVGVILDGTCNNADSILVEASKASLFDSSHVWLVLNYKDDVNSAKLTLKIFEGLDFSIDTDLVLANSKGDHYEIIELFNFGKIQGNNLEKNFLGSWSRENGLSVSLSRFKYYDRWDFHNLTLRAISVILDRPKIFKPEMLTELNYTPGVAAMTKITSRLLDILKEIHNFRFNYTISGRWIGSPARNSTLAVTNSLYWREQDISSTCARIFPQWLDWVDIFHPPATRLETKFFYLISSSGVGEYENRFLTPLSPGVWGCAAVIGVICVIVLGIAGAVENRPKTGHYAIFSVLAAVAQQAYEDGVQLVNDAFSSQSRRLILFIIGLTSMLLYNYYTSSVVSWLLNAAAPTLDSLDGLINSDLELVFEDIGYTRGWLDNPGFFYYSGFKNVKEDELRDKKVKFVKRSAKLLLPVTEGIKLVRTGGVRQILTSISEALESSYANFYTHSNMSLVVVLCVQGQIYLKKFQNIRSIEIIRELQEQERLQQTWKTNDSYVNSLKETLQLQYHKFAATEMDFQSYAYHTEPYTAHQAISKTFDDVDLCNLGALQMMKPAPVYIMAQKHSPYRKFFVWSLMRLQERGHITASRARVGGYTPTCSGSSPRALALGQAAPAFALLAAAIWLSLTILSLEVLWYKLASKNYQTRRDPITRERQIAGIIPVKHKKTIKRRCLTARAVRNTKLRTSSHCRH